MLENRIPVCQITSVCGTALRGFIETGERESVWAFASFRIFKSLAKFRVELVDVGQEHVERTLRPEIGQHVFIAHEAQREGPRPFFHPPLVTQFEKGFDSVQKHK